MASTYSAGIVTAYGAAVRGGYTGTYEQFCQDQAGFAEAAQQVREDKESVEQTVQTFEETTVPAAEQSVTDEGTRQIGLVGAAGSTQVGNVNQAGETQVENVNTAGATQVQAVEDKGEEVRRSIPQDYADLVDDVADLSIALADSTGNVFYTAWVKGKRINTTGESVDLTGATANSSANYAYQIIDCTAGDIFTLSGSSQNGSYRLWCWCTDDGTVVDKPTGNLAYEDTAIVCPETATKLLINTLTTVKYEICKGYYLVSRFANIVDPDNFSGTDNDKIKKAMDAIGNTGHGVILIKRQYSLTSSVLISHYGSADAKIIFLGIGNNAGFAVGGAQFKGAGEDRSYGALTFENIRFVGTSTLFNADYLIRVNFSNCVFDGFAYIVFVRRFMQSYYFTNCLVRNIRNVAFATSQSAPTEEEKANNILHDIVDLHVTNCVIEHGAGVVSGYSLHGIYFSNCCVEGMSAPIVKLYGDARSLVFESCYFEANNIPVEGDESTNDRNGVHFDFAQRNGYIHSVLISGNKFSGQKSENKIILLPKITGSYNAWFTITDNSFSPALPNNVYIAATPDDAALPYDNVYIDRNSYGAKLYDPNHLLVNGNDSGTLFTKELTSNDDLNAFYKIGHHHAAANTGVLNAPTQNEFYLLNIRSASGMAQIAITGTGIASRVYSGGQWGTWN